MKNFLSLSLDISIYDFIIKTRYNFFIIKTINIVANV